MHGPTNSLAHASSSYLRSAMHQPIRWQEWGEEAFALAQRENKPILLDIGAVWCHWCHVMDRESYDSAEIAALINENFIAIKVDRDERPDVDSRYQAAVQAISGQGGWPLTAFLTPDGRPFFGGTYFPPDDHYGRPSFKRVLAGIANAYKEKHSEVLESAESVMTAVTHQEAFAGHSASVDPRTIDTMVQSALKAFDRVHGGFGNQPKFPHSSALDLLIDYYTRTRSEELHAVFTTTLERMATGGIYDQLAGGFHRYSVDEKWIVPHFEKMVYDNSELLKNYVHAWQATGTPLFAAVARDIIRWVDEWLSDRERGGFYASQDADHSMDDDGDFFTWTLDEARAVLSEEELRVAADYYDIGALGEMHHNPYKNVLYVKADIESIAKTIGKTEDETLAILGSARTKMYAARLKRPMPYIDKTIYVGWNGMMISAYFQAAQALHLDEVHHFALKSLDRILAEAWNKDAQRLGHVIAYSDPKAGKRQLAGGLDDYAFTIIACLDAYEATGVLSYFHFARDIADAMLRRFADKTSGGFFDTDSTADPASLIGALTAKRKPLQDSPTPAANPAAAIALIRLYHFTNHAPYKDKAEDTLETFAGVVGHFGIYAATYGIALRQLTSPHTQVVVIGSGAQAGELYRTATAGFSLSKSVVRLGEGQAVAANLPPALAESIPHLPGVQKKATLAVLCSNFACQPPISSPDALTAAIQQAVK
ncbi:MAG TPA: thioredoxin domain-containing protein [Terriglobales bacterium]|nr:thioredoxin domain-containing protein [Terriglobales bacterium]